LLFSITFQVELLDGLNSDFLLLEEDLIGFRGEIIGELLDVIGESGREENVLNSRRKHPIHELVTDRRLQLTSGSSWTDHPTLVEQSSRLPHQGQRLEYEQGQRLFLASRACQQGYQEYR
jgi:hypothetical protein